MIGRRHFSKLLKKVLDEQVPQVREKVKTLLTNHGKTQIGTYTVENVIHGMKDMNGIFYLGSHLDANEGIRFRGLTIPEMQQKLPKIGNQPLPEAVFWLLLTGRAPNSEELKDIQETLTTKTDLPASTIHLIKNFSKEHHPMTILSMAVLDMQKNSEFAREYRSGKLTKDNFWVPTLTDGINLIRTVPRAAALIYNIKYGKREVPIDTQDWAGHFANHLGFKNGLPIIDVLRAYLAIHTDHEGGNVSAHTGYLINSALSDPYLAFSGSINGLAGPLHGLANQEVMGLIEEIDKHLKSKNINFTSSDDKALHQELDKFVRDWIKKRVIPGFGHGKLKITDPRFTHLEKLSLEKMPNNRYIQLVHALNKVVPAFLLEKKTVKNPYPNVDAHSGVLLQETGIREHDYYTVVFAVSRTIGVMANLVWARALRLNIERPGSLTIEGFEKLIAKNTAGAAQKTPTK